MLRKAIIAGVVASTIFWLLASSALGDDAAISDPKDRYRIFDIASASHSHAQRSDGSWRIRHTISMYDRWRSHELRNRHNLAFITIHIRDNGRSVQIFWKDGLKARIRHGRRVIEYLPVWRTNRKSVVVSLPRRLLGRIGDGYRWLVFATWGPRRCNDTGQAAAACSGLTDRAPNGGTVHHDLRD